MGLLKMCSTVESNVQAMPVYTSFLALETSCRRLASLLFSSLYRILSIGVWSRLDYAYDAQPQRYTGPPTSSQPYRIVAAVISMKVCEIAMVVANSGSCKHWREPGAHWKRERSEYNMLEAVVRGSLCETCHAAIFMTASKAIGRL